MAREVKRLLDNQLCEGGGILKARVRAGEFNFFIIQVCLSVWIYID